MPLRFGFGVGPMLDAQGRRNCAGAGEAITYPRGAVQQWSPSHLCKLEQRSSAGSVGSPLMLPCDAQELLNSGSGDALMADVHVLDAEEDLLLPITLTRVPARSPAVSSGSGIPLLTDPQLRRSCKRMSLGPTSSIRERMSLGPILSSRAPVRSHAVSLWVWRRFDARRKLASLTWPEAPASDCLAGAAGCFCCLYGMYPQAAEQQ